jgi:hypothetical protein
MPPPSHALFLKSLPLRLVALKPFLHSTTSTKTGCSQAFSYPTKQSANALTLVNPRHSTAPKHSAAQRSHLKPHHNTHTSAPKSHFSHHRTHSLSYHSIKPATHQHLRPAKAFTRSAKVCAFKLQSFHNINQNQVSPSYLLTQVVGITSNISLTPHHSFTFFRKSPCLPSVPPSSSPTLPSRS